MSYGLRVWDASGKLQVEVTDRIPRYEASYTVPNFGGNAGATYTVTIPGFSTSTHFFYSNHDSSTISLTVNNGSIVCTRRVNSSVTVPAFTIVVFVA